ncbi:GNAT family N-acetyltransferase [Aliiroseovarius sp.]|uniref:GNAT family N-acetyltransferase n=1 Tax=Aliiroseovarius sp. TaxID=1872442 RepID=UPI002622DD0F|nr:GNAT family N-acetyltransferase [Aliiroseovarius sp.]
MTQETPNPSADQALIRPARPEDARPLTLCIDAAYARYRARIADLPPVSLGIEQDIVTNCVWVAEVGGKIVAGLVMVPGQGFVKLANLAVHPDFGGRRLGRKLIALCEAEARRRGAAEVRLNTHVDMPENIALYTRLGWQEVGVNGNTVTMVKKV